jgi:hypothetical protein
MEKRVTYLKSLLLMQTAMWRRRWTSHSDFFLLLMTFFSFRLASVWFMRPGGYIRDYTDLIYYQARASWQDFGFLPYRDYWSEYPPLFAWFSVWIDALAQRLPLWDDERLWYAVFFGAAMTLAETATFICLYALARRLHRVNALRAAWLYAGLFLPVYLLSGWFDAAPVMTIFLTLTILLYFPSPGGALLAGAVAGVGAAWKLVPLAALAAAPLTRLRRHEVALAAFAAAAVLLGVYAYAYLLGPTMTLASLRSLVERSGWSTVYALADGFTRLGAVVGDPFDPGAKVGLYEASVPQGAIWLGWLSVGAVMFFLVWRRQQTASSESRDAVVIAFAALTYVVLLLAYPAWNPQYALYLLPFLVLVWPSARGLIYALALSALTLAEHPIYFNLIGDYSPAFQQLIEVDYTRILWLIVLLRTGVLAMVAVDLGWMLLRPTSRSRRWAPVLASAAMAMALLWNIPNFLKAYTAGRLVTTPLRTAILTIDAMEGRTPVIFADLTLARRMRPLLKAPEQVIVAGGLPGRFEPIPVLAERQEPFVFVRKGAEGSEISTYLEERNLCPQRRQAEGVELWFCNGADLVPLAKFAEGVELIGARLPEQIQNPLHATLLWHAETVIAQDYTVFFHIVNADGAIVGQWDQPPDAGETPTISWMPGAIFDDNYRIPLQQAALRRPIRLLVGMYDPNTGRRLPVLHAVLPFADDAVEVKVYP